MTGAGRGIEREYALEFASQTSDGVATVGVASFTIIAIAAMELARNGVTVNAIAPTARE
jgi:NAD(P)-dependent dehydrogenase (short-subunit alcohol dehydrogenase family)